MPEHYQYRVIETIEVPATLDSCVGCPLAYDDYCADPTCIFGYWEDECNLLKFVKEKRNEAER